VYKEAIARAGLQYHTERERERERERKKERTKKRKKERNLYNCTMQSYQNNFKDIKQPTS
jgi:hypothetical protein